MLPLLAPKGTMRVGLYSEVARRAVVEVRALIRERGYPSTVEGIRALRQELIRNGEDQRWKTLLHADDFYSTSGCRDLLFNVMEHRTTIPEIASLLDEHGLLFHGFEVDPKTMEKLQGQYPGDEAQRNVDYWHAFEADNPHTFRLMYVFSVSKNVQASV